MTELRNRLGHWSEVKGKQDLACAESTAAGRLGSLGRATREFYMYSVTVSSRRLKLLSR